jgi:Resolvase, N terminal domain
MCDEDFSNKICEGLVKPIQQFHHRQSGRQQGIETVLTSPQTTGRLVVQTCCWADVLTPMQGEQRVSRVAVQWSGHAQQAALVAAGAERVFAEKVSGAVTDRKALGRALAALGAGDVLLVTRLDRLARRAGRQPAPTRQADDNDPGGLAEFERSLILSRTAGGRDQGQGPRRAVGRKQKLTPHQRRGALARRQAEESLVEIGRSYVRGAKPVAVGL